MPDVPAAPPAPVHSALPASAPFGACEPPYYAVVFTSVRTDDHDGYEETNELMDELVKEVPGYLGTDHARTPGGLSLTVGYFRDLAAIEAWRSDSRHRAAQKHGREHWYERYTVHVAKVERSYAFEAEGDATT
ncbi:antibiotic biosynthesis monooxygenase [Streptomyces sp. RY43-2]|uniref:Antibiotic biosynthesis monooxygenase n=1 Tax=Streptomyces macrolidinus TaxID=2952607 RepID=A0ABT0ZHV8_9ACTN|nr:antibiotic biosynthesis monooxygenase [Streptomyces macrolidinus]MCN9243159.1 antibiotic biosynthesis monooxygenase [Streptomyces macrolidinus]